MLYVTFRAGQHHWPAFFTSAIPRLVSNFYAPQLQRLLRFGSAARCEAGLRPAGVAEFYRWGLRPWFGLCPDVGQRPNEGHSPISFFLGNGGA